MSLPFFCVRQGNVYLLKKRVLVTGDTAIHGWMINQVSIGTTGVRGVSDQIS